MSKYSHLSADLANENSAPTKIARLVGSKRSVLDVGCAHGYLAEVLRTQGCRVTGVERDGEDAARARAHCERVIVRDVEEPGWVEELAEERFDVVVFADVLEHLRDPAAVLRQSLGLLEPNEGFIVASVPNVAHLSVRLELLLGSFRPEPLGILDSTHLHFFTRDSLEELLASCGMAVESWECTTNEVAEHVVADYLRRAGLPYTAKLRELLGTFEAQAFQFVIKGRPAAGPVARLREPLEKPLQVMEETIREFERVRSELAQAAAELRRLRATPAEVERPRPGGLRVLQVVHQFLPQHAAGTEIYCSDLSFALCRRGHAVRVLSAAPDPREAGTTVQWEGDSPLVVEKLAGTREYRRLGPVAGFFDRFDNPEARRAIRWVLDEMHPDVVHVQHLLYLSAELVPECRLRGIPVVVTLNDYWFLCHRVKLRRRDGALCAGPRWGLNCPRCLGTGRLFRSRLNPVAVGANLYRHAYLIRQLLKADRILAPSRYLRAVYERNGVPAGRITLCDYGTPEPPSDLASGRVPGDGGRPLRFGFLGTLMYDKGVHVLIEAFNELPLGVAELHLFGMAVEPAYVAELRRRCPRADFRWRGPLAHASRWQALAEVDVLVVPSVWYENSPLTVHEAYAAGVPVIASAIGGLAELVRDGVTGLTFPPGDARALGQCLRKVIDDPRCIDTWRQAIVPPKTMAAHAEEIEALYRELVKARSRSL